MQPYFGKNILELHYIDKESFIFLFNLVRGLTEDLNLQADFDFSHLHPSHELYSEENKKVIGKLKLETAQDLDLDEAVFFKSKYLPLNIKRNSPQCKHKGVQNHFKHNIEDY